MGQATRKVLHRPFEPARVTGNLEKRFFELPVSSLIRGLPYTRYHQMVPARLICCAAFFAAATIFIIRANVIFGRMLDEVNSNRAANEQISFLWSVVPH